MSLNAVGYFYSYGEAIQYLASDPKIADKTGGVYCTWELSEIYGFKDIDGTQPH